MMRNNHASESEAEKRERLTVVNRIQDYGPEGNVHTYVYVHNSSDDTLDLVADVTVDWTAVGNPSFETCDLERRTVSGLESGGAAELHWCWSPPDTFRLEESRIATELRNDGDVAYRERWSAFFFHQRDEDQNPSYVAPSLFYNDQNRERRVTFDIESNSPLPDCFTTWPTPGVELTLEPREALAGYIASPKRSSRNPRPSTKSDRNRKTTITVIMRDTASGKEIMREDFPYGGDDELPAVENVGTSVAADGYVTVSFSASDRQSGLHKYMVYYSLDDGEVWNAVSPSWVSGDFRKSTAFEARIGPFVTDTEVCYSVVVQDSVSHVAASETEWVTVHPVDSE